MRIHRGGPGLPMVAPECFRLLRLKVESQNDADVLKPVLDELEVLRLSCALGMLTDVAAKDFEMALLEPQDLTTTLCGSCGATCSPAAPTKHTMRLRTVVVWCRCLGRKPKSRRSSSCCTSGRTIASAT